MEDKMNGRLTPKEELIRLEGINIQYYNISNVATTAEERRHISKITRDFKNSYSYEQLSNIKNPMDRKCTYKEIEGVITRILSKLKNL